MKVLVLITFFVVQGWAMVTVPDLSCPVVFTGEVKQRIEPVGGISAFSTERILFRVDETEKGNLRDEVGVDVLINSGLNLVVGERYKVHLRSGRVCSIEEV